MKMLATLLLAGLSLQGPAHGETHTFALIGDMPYADRDSIWFERLVDHINADDSVAWVIHAGDIKTGGTPCSDAYLMGRRERFSRFDDPFILTPGDNEWTDCHRNKAGRYDPLERLAKLRSIFYPEVGMTLGKRKMKVRSQASMGGFDEFRENVMWERDGVFYATIHIVGSRNGMAPFQKPEHPKDRPTKRTKKHDEEVMRRTAAGIAWMRRAFKEAGHAGKGLFLTLHAGMGLERQWVSDPPHYEAFLGALREETQAFGRPVVLAHGDSHYFRIDKPLRTHRGGKRIWNFTRVETFGSADVNWLEVIVDPESENVFRFEMRIVKKE